MKKQSLPASRHPEDPSLGDLGLDPVPGPKRRHDLLPGVTSVDAQRNLVGNGQLNRSGP